MPRKTADPELHALSVVLNAVAPLAPAQRSRVLAYAYEREMAAVSEKAPSRPDLTRELNSAPVLDFPTAS